MQRREAVLPYGLIVGGCGIALILLPAVHWVVCVQALHELVAQDLREYRGCGDLWVVLVATDARLHGYPTGEAIRAIYSHESRGDRESLYRFLHGEKSGAQDVVGIYGLRALHADADSEGVFQ